ncbi:hypothetical protein B0A55_00164 [Friedmanniomyces simplex]|uniref:Extracellular membrane protein CFEM domain-containing protein n=1 Tax=Friedmanniomyces simplex TaxID=329884 RepID=A0A4V5NKY0_9PEZI|nr:hypothetical protein B0A55_00164 [Friedmanniomyces simplex]
MKLHASGAVLLLLCTLSTSQARIQFDRKPVIVPHTDPEPVVPIDPVTPDTPVENPDTPVGNPDTNPVSDPTDQPDPIGDPNASPPIRPPTSPIIIPGVYEPSNDGWPSLGNYDDTSEEPFTNFEGEWDIYFSKVLDYFVAEETYYANGIDVARVTGAGSPFKTGQPTGQVLRFTQTAQSPSAQTTITTFDPAQPTDICKAMTSLGGYCANGGTQCACYSGSYYVPDQWNSLAAGCARLTSACPSYSNGTASAAASGSWCSLASQAAALREYCPTSIAGTTTVAFAAEMTSTTPTAVAAAGVTSTAGSTSAPSPTTDSGSGSSTSTESQGGAGHAAAVGGVWIAVLVLSLSSLICVQ